MNIADRISIKSKTYLLVSLSVVVALVLSFVGSSGLNTIRTELDDLIFATEIERYTNRLILEEQTYRLNANGSVYDIEAAKQAYDKAIEYMGKIARTLEQISEQTDSELLLNNLQATESATDEYKRLYLQGVSLLTELNRQAGILEHEGEYITRQIQEYVEAKRVDMERDINQKTLAKINNGSNIWQYTYVTRLHEKRYRLSPDEEQLSAFNDGYAFMMSEWARLKNMSDQDFEFEKLDAFKSAAEKYEQAMRAWVDRNSQLVNDILPRMKERGDSVIRNAIRSAEESVRHMSQRRNTIALTLFTVSIITIILGILFGSMIASSISSAIKAFQSGLMNFFQYLNQQQKEASPIAIRGRDEISMLAELVNENIVRIQHVINRKAEYQQALLEWSRVDYQNDSTTIRKATELSARAMHVNRVSIWLFNDDKTWLHCADLFLSDENHHESGASLFIDDHPAYFKAIFSNEVLLIDNAREDPRTRDFCDDYLLPHDIYSMLILPIVQAGHLAGIICHEKTGAMRNWGPDEQDFASSVVHAISLSLEIKKRHQIQQQLRAQEETLRHRAHHDILTNLPNRTLFYDRLKQAIKQAQRAGSKIAVLFIDLDHFKSINDSMGHKVGDELLIEVASRLKGQIRKTDTLARLGGDEFVIVLDTITDTDTIVEITQNLLKIMEAPIELSSQSFYVTLSAGVAVYPDDGDTPENLLKHADTAMYQAKEDGRNTYQFYTMEMTEKAFERIAMGASFRKGLEKHEFIAHYQPQMDATSGRLVGLEALVRWEHPELGMVMPGKFLSFANDTGLIMPMDEQVMQSAMSQMARWHEAGLQPGVLALNLSVRHLQQKNFIDTVLKMLEESGCKPQWLEFEVTEGQIMTDPGAAIKMLHKIKDLGISLAIDDFGTGYSSLSQLKRLPINKLKIDRSFVRDLPDDEEDVVISRTVIALAQNIGLSVIAEGVETTAQKQFLLDNGCRYIQGYLYGKPMPAEAIEEQLRTLRDDISRPRDETPPR